ncbi:MAG: polyphosphate kinase 2 [SAR324 cluster bacterium]|nr:polyphosphate kinase 2 [SAR324 cluster bacterium]
MAVVRKKTPRKSASTRTESKPNKMQKEEYERELAKLHMELVKLQYWIWQKGLRVVIIFEGRDISERRETIKRITEPLNARGCSVVALGNPSDREKTQWYFQRYVSYLPAKGEMVLFNRSWYNRAGVERVMKFCTDDQYREFMRSCPEFERMLTHSGIILLKYWFSLSYEEQERRFHERATNPMQRWEISDIAIESLERWDEYSKAKDEMLFYTDILEAHWKIVEADDSSAACLNCINDILCSIPYEDIMPEPMDFKTEKVKQNYERVSREEYRYVENKYGFSGV